MYAADPEARQSSELFSELDQFEGLENRESQDIEVPCTDNDEVNILYSPPPPQSFLGLRRVHLLICMTAFGICIAVLNMVYTLGTVAKLRINLFDLRTPSAIIHDLDSPQRSFVVGFGSPPMDSDMSNLFWKTVEAAEVDAFFSIGIRNTTEIIKSCLKLPEKNPLHCKCSENSNGVLSCKGHENDILRHEWALATYQNDFRHFVASSCPYEFQEDRLRSCAVRMTGTWHSWDLGRKFANKHYSRLHEAKGAYLDALGEPTMSERRSAVRGLEQVLTFNKDKYSELKVLLLDEISYKDHRPCESLKSYKGIGEESDDQEKCCWRDFFFFDKKDGWCGKQKSDKKLNYCDTSSDLFGQNLVSFSKNETHTSFTEFPEEESHFCDVLGLQQRSLLNKVLQESGVKILVTPSSLSVSENCNIHDSISCYSVALKNLHYLISKSPNCVIVLSTSFDSVSQIYTKSNVTKEESKDAQIQSLNYIELAVNAKEGDLGRIHFDFIANKIAIKAYNNHGKKVVYQSIPLNGPCGT
eukprot:GHVP01040225.1.p1 GENE.GHVP01040225.1~~GHVP01040225.1.p1  ORF type:complete len:527 (+),score=78.01 GHVP01040225.1:323-1903(+)